MLITVLFVLLLLLSLCIVACGFIHFFSRVNLGTLLMILVITDSSLIVLFQFLAYISISYSAGEWWNGYMGSGSYWVGTISFWMLLTVVSLLYIFFFRGAVDNGNSKIIRVDDGSGGNNGVSGIQGVSSAPGIRGISGVYAGQTIYLKNQAVMIGSGNGAAIKIQDNYVSAEHCAVRFNLSKECYEVYINSPYGVYIDAVLQKGGWYLARRGSVLSIGSSAQKFQLL